MVRFLHTADWHLGMPARFLDDEAAGRFGAARLDAVRALAGIARAQGCAFVLACGDLFDSNLVHRRTVHQATAALGEMPVPVLILPGNHDPDDPASVYRRDAFQRSAPANVRVLDAGLVEIAPGVEVVAAPWSSKRPAEDLAARACRGLEPAPAATVRVLAAHGATDALSPQDTLDPALIRLAPLEAHLAAGHIHFVALGDRHSVTRLGQSHRVWYPGAPEVTAFDEDDAGQALIVEVDAGGCRVRPVRTGVWRFVRQRQDVSGEDGVRALADWLGALPDPSRTAVRLELTGTLRIAEHAALTATLERCADILAGLELVDDGRQLAVLPSEEDFEDLGFGGFAASALEALRRQAAAGGPGAQTAEDALKLAFRLGQGVRP